MQFLKQSTAVTVQLGPFVDETDGFTAETGLTISQADVRLSKNGAAYAQASESSAATHDENGWYRKALDTTDTGTLGRLVVAVHESGARPVQREFMVVPANVYDSLVAGSDLLSADVRAVNNNETVDYNLESWLSNAIGSDSKTLISTDAQATAYAAMADALLCRDWTSVSGEAARSVLNALRHLRNKWSISGGTLTVTEEDDSTSAWTATVTTNEGAAPVTAVDPA